MVVNGVVIGDGGLNDGTKVSWRTRSDHNGGEWWWWSDVTTGSRYQNQAFRVAAREFFIASIYFPDIYALHTCKRALSKSVSSYHVRGQGHLSFMAAVQGWGVRCCC